MAHHIIEEINALKTNKEKVEKFLNLGLDPRYGLSAEITKFMYDLYQQSSGDNTYAGRYNCGACQDTIFRKLKDFVNYGDNVGKPLINWSKEKEKKKKEDDSTDSDTNQA
jgi:hypothetical protein